MYKSWLKNTQERPEVAAKEWDALVNATMRLPPLPKSDKLIEATDMASHLEITNMDQAWDENTPFRVDLNILKSDSEFIKALDQKMCDVVQLSPRSMKQLQAKLHPNAKLPGQNSNNQRDKDQPPRESREAEKRDLPHKSHSRDSKRARSTSKPAAQQQPRPPKEPSPPPTERPAHKTAKPHTGKKPAGGLTPPLIPSPPTAASNKPMAASASASPEIPFVAPPPNMSRGYGAPATKRYTRHRQSS